MHLGLNFLPRLKHLLGLRAGHEVNLVLRNKISSSLSGPNAD